MRMEEVEQELLLQDLDHDAIATAQSRELINSGFMEEEFACYGTAYIEAGKIKYYISSTERSMNKFTANCILYNIYPTPARYFVMRCNVLAGAHDEIRQNFKRSTAYMLQEDYPKVYFAAMENLSAYKSDDQAMPILTAVKAEVENTFDREALEVFRGLALEALTMKHLTKEGYAYWMNWLADEYRKMEEDILEYNYYKRSYSGFVYENHGRLQYVRNAFETKVIEQRNRMIAAGKVVTPIMHKDFFAGNYGALDEGREQFQVLLKQYFNEAFFDILKELHRLPSVVPQREFAEWMQKVQETGKEKAVTSLRYHGHLWHVL